MKVYKKKVELLQFKYNPKWQWIDVNFGVVVFRLMKGKMMIDETPYKDETLVSINNIEIKNNRFFIFKSFFQKQETRFEIDCSAYENAIELAKYMKEINENGAVFNENHDEIEIMIKDKDLSFKIGNNEIDKRFVVGYNKYRNYFTLVYPEPMKEYKIGKCFLDTDIVRVNCVGTNQYDEKDMTEGFEYEWKLNLPNSTKELSKKLLNVELKNR